MSGSPCGDETTFREDLELMQMEDTVGKTFENDLNESVISISVKAMQCKGFFFFDPKHPVYSKKGT